MKVLAIAIAGVLLTSVAALAAGSGPGNAAEGKAAEGKSQRYQLVHQLVTKWGPYVQEAYKTDVRNWTKEMRPIFQSANLEKLQGGVDALTFDGMNNALLGIASDGPEITPAALGDATSDLVYTPVRPCRLLDTREAGGAIAGMTTRAFELNGPTNYTSQGGSNTNCGGIASTSNIAAAVINFTVVGPVSVGYITAFAVNTPQPLASSLNYDGRPGEIKGNEVIVPVDQSVAQFEFNVYTLATTHLVGDIVGYFKAPSPTSLECTSMFGETSAAAGALFNLSIQACPAGFQTTGAGCGTTTFTGANWAVNGLYKDSSSGSLQARCTGTNPSAGTITVRGTRQCCRVPGG